MEREHLMSGPVIKDAHLGAPATGNAAPRDATEIFHAHGEFAWRMLQRLGVRDADLEDVLQEVFVAVYKQLPTFEGRSKTTTWLYAICVRVASTHRRRAWVRREQVTGDLPETASADASPERTLDDAEERRALGEVLDLMDIEKRALLVMFELDEMPCEAIAEVLAVPVGTVHSRLPAARREFETALRRWRARQDTSRSWWSFRRSR